MKYLIPLFCCCCCLAAHTEENPLDEGHSSHGEVFNEGPRQAAVLIEGTGKVHFPVTTTSQEARAFFDQGIGQLHGYWDFEAERSFRQVAAMDPGCAMAYWGMAMANIKNAKRGKGFIEEAVKHRDEANDIEKQWIDGLAAFLTGGGDEKKRRVALVKSLEGILEKNPADIEAKAFLIRQIYQNSREGIKIEDFNAVNQLAEDIFQVNPLHPVHHYVIHMWDREKPENALKSAALNGSAAPAIAHMWHMPGHIYSKLKRYPEAAWQQEASARVDHAHTMRFQILPDQIHNFAHNNEWLIRNLNYLGRCDDAVSLAKNMTSLPRKPRFQKPGDDSTYNPGGSSWQFGRQRLKDTLFRFEKWEELLSLENTPYLNPDERTLKKADLEKYYAIARFETGDLEGGNAILNRIEKDLTAQKKKKEQAGNKAKKYENSIRDLESSFQEISVYAALNANPADLTRASLHLSKVRNVAKERLAWLWHRAGNYEQAVKLAEEAVKASQNQVHPLAVQVQVLHAAGKTEEAKSAFSRLRKVAAEADPDLPVLQRLAPIAKELGFPEGWRLSPDRPDTERPDLDSLGPFRWCPPPAADFALQDSTGRKYQLSERAGKNTLVIFYLGKGCSHCMEQLNKFAPATGTFRDKGIEIIAISSDTVEGLAETFVTSGDEDGKNPFPFPLLSDADLSVFKQYRAFDDFENQPLHGTFLIDGKQNIRWQDISFEPFMYSDWLLRECVRLLEL